MFAPLGWIVDRMLRRLAPATRSLDAAGGGRRWADARTVTSSGVVHASAATVAARAAHFALNDPRGARIVETLVANIVGTGIVPRSQHPSETVRARLHRDWSAWTDRADVEGRGDFYLLQSLAARDLVVFGEALFLLGSEVSGAPILRRLHPEQLDRSLTRRLADGGVIVQGVEFDPSGRIVAFHIRPVMPGDPLAGLALAPVREPASGVLHLFRPLMPGQVRGLSWFAPVLLSAKELDALLDAMLVRAKVAAMHVGVVTSPDGAVSWDGDQSGEALDVTLEPGSMPVLPPGRQIEFMDIPDQGGASALLTETLRAIAVGTGVTYEQLSGDYSRVNYSSERSAKLEFRRTIEGIQHHVMVFGFCRPVWNRFVRWQVLTGTVSAAAYLADAASFDGAKWLPPAWPWVDPQNEATAAEIALRNNLRSRSEIIAERGYDAEDVDAEIAADRARLAALGIAPVTADRGAAA
jgi:lambda family phage portal protein